MSLTETETEALNQLQNAYDQEGGTEALNVPIRELLKRYARGEDMKYLV